MRSFLKIKIYRSKFIAYTIFVVSIGLSLGVLTCGVLLNQWVENARNESLSAFTQVENTLQYNEDRIEAYMQRVYSNTGLMSDVRSFLSNSAESYLTSRLQHSSYSQPLISFPDDLKIFLNNRGQGIITQISLHTDQYGNIVQFDPNGNKSFQFNIPNNDHAFQETIHKGFVVHKKVLDPNQISRQIGEVRFLISSERVFKAMQNYRLYRAAAVSDKGDILPITHEDSIREEWYQQALEDGRNRGTLSTTGLNRAYYVTYTSSEFKYRFISIVDLSMLIRENAGTLLSIFIIAFASMISVLLLIIYNLRDDAKFLHRIIGSIGRVKMADFTSDPPARYRRNEYGMIAKELDDMIHQLDKHIRTEYLLKIKQQETEMKALQNQINPHFLYNTLEAIRATAMVNHDDYTADAIATLGGLFRDIMKYEEDFDIASELELLQKYLKIMEFKYPDRFYYQMNVDQALMSLPTIKFWMQPLAENFFVHGFQPDDEFNLFVVNGWETETAFVMEFSNNGKWIAEDRLVEIRRTLFKSDHAPVKSIGLRNVYTRLLFFYGEDFSIMIDNNEEAGVHITVTIPKEVLANV
ncbi:sensor histidine kinase [Paenibacillus sp. 1001270B_150601_E10]|uniref:sensor histidine kinase n=1 Tax=Paenibacillus sp. 1001270B_150601_E10 TaxID=2787079 RepID=UPI00189E5875|nr:histidine kinase [Paenibacillus sp. 1001270B_150601_E10]